MICSEAYGRALTPRGGYRTTLRYGNQLLWLVQPAIYRYIKQLELGRDALPLYKLLRRNPLKLSPELRWRVRTWLADKPARYASCGP